MFGPTFWPYIKTFFVGLRNGLALHKDILVGLSNVILGWPYMKTF